MPMISGGLLGCRGKFLPQIAQPVCLVLANQFADILAWRTHSRP